MLTFLRSRSIGLAALSRPHEPGSARRPFFLYVDDIQSFTTLSFANMMAELRKYGVGLILARQNLHQLEPDIRHAVLGNAGTLVSIRVGTEDALMLAAVLQPKSGVLNLANRDVYLKLMMDGAPSRPLSAVTLDLGRQRRTKPS